MQIDQNDHGLPMDASGRTLRAIALSHYDQDWRNGRIGAWLRAYRPDLLDGTPDAAGRSNR